MTYLSGRGRPVEALSGIDLDVGAGELVSVIGPTGCGKSTLLHVVGGLRRPSGGHVAIAGQPVTGPQPSRVAFVFQDYTLFPWRTVLANVEIGLQFRGVPRLEREAAARRYLELVGLRAFADAYPAELSGGMQQRVALARALCVEPEILLMDEPFGALDEQTRLVLGEELSAILGTTRKTVVFVTHSLAEAVHLADRVVVLTSRPGRIKAVLDVPAPRPRPPAFLKSDMFARLRNELFDLLHDEIRRAALTELAAERGP
jgi:NitT/TauT family transport system ATP-binding protein